MPFLVPPKIPSKWPGNLAQMGEKLASRAGYATCRGLGCAARPGDARLRHPGTDPLTHTREERPGGRPTRPKPPWRHARELQPPGCGASARISAAIRACVAFPGADKPRRLPNTGPFRERRAYGRLGSAEILGRLKVPLARRDDACAPAQSGQKPLKRSAASSVYRTVCWMFRCPR